MTNENFSNILNGLNLTARQAKTRKDSWWFDETILEWFDDRAIGMGSHNRCHKVP
jgi:hypothetical protein